MRVVCQRVELGMVVGKEGTVDLLWLECTPRPLFLLVPSAYYSQTWEPNLVSNKFLHLISLPQCLTKNKREMKSLFKNSKLKKNNITYLTHQIKQLEHNIILNKSKF